MPSERPTSSRRALGAGVAWSIPAVALGAPAPAIAKTGNASARAPRHIAGADDATTHRTSVR